MKTILVIPAEGDSPETESWYVSRLRRHYGTSVKIIVFDNFVRTKRWQCLGAGMQRTVQDFIREARLGELEIHAQGGLGAYIATLFMRSPIRITRVFFVGGAPCDAMTLIAKFFHRCIAPIWYHSPFPFFADDPNPTGDLEVEAIRRSSTSFMQRFPRLYLYQLLWISHWKLPAEWRASCSAYYVPNGDTVRPKWWDNTYNEQKAIRIWKGHQVETIRKPGRNFSFYSMMPAEELFAVIDQLKG